MRRALLLAAVAVFAAACAIPHQDRVSYDRSDFVRTTGYPGLTDPLGAHVPTGPTDQPGYAAERPGKTGPAHLQGWSYAGTTGFIGDGPAGQEGVAGTVALWTTWCD